MTRIGLAPLTHKVNRTTGAGVTQAVVYRAALAGKFPAEFINGRWSVEEADLPLVIAGMGLAATSPVQAAA